MTQDRNAFKAGLFIVISVLLIFGMIVGIKGYSRLIEPTQTLRTQFKLADNVGGLRVGDDVRIGGLKVGTVQQLDLTTPAGSDEPAITVTFSIPKRIEVRKDARVAIESTVTGASNLNIDQLGKTQLATANDMLKGNPSGFTTIINSLGDIAPEAKGFLVDARTQTLPRVNAAVDKYSGVADHFKDAGAKASDLLGDVKGRVPNMVERYNTLADRASEAMTNVRDLFGETKGDFRTTIANLATATTSVKDKLPALLEKADTLLAKANVSLEKVNVALDDVQKTVENTRALASDAREIVAANRTKIFSMIAALKTTGDNLKFASAEIRRSPWRLLYKPGAGEMANLNLYDSARQFAEGANDLSDAAGALRDAIKSGQNDPKSLQDLVNKLDESFTKFNTVEQQLWKNVKE